MIKYHSITVTVFIHSSVGRKIISDLKAGIRYKKKTVIKITIIEETKKPKYAIYFE